MTTKLDSKQLVVQVRGALELLGDALEGAEARVKELPPRTKAWRMANQFRLALLESQTKLQTAIRELTKKVKK